MDKTVEESESVASKIPSEDGFLEFLKELARYYTAFLETDFRKHRIPKRSIKLRNPKGYRTGINIRKYKSFGKLIWTLLQEEIKPSNEFEIQKKKHKSELKPSILNFIHETIDTLEQKIFDAIITDILNNVDKIREEYSDDWGTFDHKVRKTIQFHSYTHILRPLLDALENSLVAEPSLGIDSVYTLEGDLVDLICEDIEENIDKPLSTFFNKSKNNDLKECLNEFLDRQIIVNKLNSYFEGFSGSDLFVDFLNLNETRRMIDKQEIYLYLGKIHYNKNDYPLFYIPLDVIQESDRFKLSFDSRIFVNKKALEYIAQEYKEQKNRAVHLNSLKDRILYLAEGECVANKMQPLFSDVVACFNLSGELNLSDPSFQHAKSLLVNLTNDIYLCSFDRSDEALINDYENIKELLEKGADPLAISFAEIVKSFMTEEPKSFDGETEKEWVSKGISERLIYDAPIPLNEEQRKISSAINKKGCKYITVQGPPGTGKSHTITGIVFDALMKGSSVLVLSDKKEALDVVVDKITVTINKVRGNEDFQNPILRLDKANYHNIFSQDSLDRIKEHYKATEAKAPDIDNQIGKIKSNLSNKINQYVKTYSEIDLNRIFELNKLEDDISPDEDMIDFEIDKHFCQILSYVRDLYAFFENKTDTDEYNFVLNILEKNASNLMSDEALDSIEHIKIASKLNKKNVGDDLSIFLEVSLDAQEYFRDVLQRYHSLAPNFFMRIWNFSAIKQMNSDINEKFELSRQINLSKDVLVLEGVIRAIATIKNALRYEKGEGGFQSVCSILMDDHCPSQAFANQLKLAKIISDYCDGDITNFLNEVGIKFDLASMKNSRLLANNKSLAEKLRCYANLKNEIMSKFGEIPDLNYVATCRQLEELQTFRMTNVIDKRVIEFEQNNRKTATNLRETIRKKQEFPRDEFKKLRQAFPCIIAGIRDYAEYIPLEAGQFDLVIIDEASQVSIAQAFSALLRAKKILILGDAKQFSNVKTTHASREINQSHMSEIRQSFSKNISNNNAKLQEVDNFNIGKSILDFFGSISNYNVMLTKHFRGYKELISFSSLHFYSGRLQAIKIRSKPIKDVLKFTQLEYDEELELESSGRINLLESKFIIDELEGRIKNENYETVGIITPFSDQQKFLSGEVIKSEFYDEIYNRLKLKIMTFDTCQGEERDTIYYSMVATPALDKTKYIFPTTLRDDEYSARSLRRQRLNVGFSRSKECMHFVLSKPLDDFDGAIGLALQHYYKEIALADNEPGSEDVESPMEAKVLAWIKNTAFYQQNKDKIRLHAQFPIGKYLKQLDIGYEHPNYRCDFLLQYSDGGQDTHIIIEYDGFKEHFTNLEDVNDLNYEFYRKPEDVEREKILESYGYEFLRINRFNTGKDPVLTLSERLENLIKKKILLN